MVSLPIDGGSISSNLSTTSTNESSVDLSVTSKPLTVAAAAPFLIVQGPPTQNSRDVTSSATLNTSRGGNISGDWLGAASGGNLATGNGFQLDTSGEFLMTSHTEVLFGWSLAEQTLSEDAVFLDGTNRLKIEGTLGGFVDGELSYKEKKTEGSLLTGADGLIASLDYGWKVGNSVDAGHSLHVEGKVSSDVDLTVKETVTDSGLRVWVDTTGNGEDWLNLDYHRRETLYHPTNLNRTGVLEGRLLIDTESESHGGVDIELFVNHGDDHASGHANLDLDENGHDNVLLKIVYQETHTYVDANTFFSDVGTSVLGIRSEFDYGLQFDPRVTLFSDGTWDVTGEISVDVNDVLDVQAGFVSDGIIRFINLGTATTHGTAEHYVMVEAHAESHFATTRTLAPGATVGVPSKPTSDFWITLEAKHRDVWYDPGPFVMWR